jgi:hypothetical protein
MAKARPSANIEIQVERCLIKRLMPYTSNAPTNSNAQINQLAAPMTEFGWMNPILVDADDGVIDAHWSSRTKISFAITRTWHASRPSLRTEEPGPYLRRTRFALFMRTSGYQLESPRYQCILRSD